MHFFVYNSRQLAHDRRMMSKVEIFIDHPPVKGQEDDGSIGMFAITVECMTETKTWTTKRVAEYTVDAIAKVVPKSSQINVDPYKIEAVERITLRGLLKHFPKKEEYLQTPAVELLNKMLKKADKINENGIQERSTKHKLQRVDMTEVIEEMLKADDEFSVEYFIVLQHGEKGNDVCDFHCEITIEELIHKCQEAFDVHYLAKHIAKELSKNLRGIEIGCTPFYSRRGKSHVYYQL
jgi:hypothetical protein